MDLAANLKFSNKLKCGGMGPGPTSYERNICSLIIRTFNYLTFKLIRLREYASVLMDAYSLRNEKSILFLDIGSNIGQGARWFARFFRNDAVCFELFEPNPNCTPFLVQFAEEFKSRRKEVILHHLAIGTKEGLANLYGLGSGEGGKLNLGASLVKEHNSSRYHSEDLHAIKVLQVDLSSILVDRAKNYSKIVVKMDVEGLEIEILQHLITTKTIQLIDILYVEFHSKYRSKDQKSQIKKREKKLKKLIQKFGVRVRVWH